MKEHNKNKNQTHLIVNEVLKTSADVICLEKLNDIKHKGLFMKRIERLKRVVSEARDTASYDSSRLRRGIPSSVLKQILRSEWRLSNFRDWDMSKNELIFQTGSVSNVSGTSGEDLSGSGVYTSVKINDIGDVESITVMLVESMRWFEREGPSATYTYTVNDIHRSGEVAHLFQMAEEEVKAILNQDYNTYDDVPSTYQKPRIIHRGRHWGGESRKRSSVRGRRMSEGRYNLRRYPEADPANVDYSVDIQDVLDAFESIVSSTGWYRGKSQDGRWEFDTQMSFDMISVYKILFNANGVSYTYPFDEYNPTEVLGIYEGSPDNLLPVSEVKRPLTKLWEKLRYSGNIPDVLPKQTVFGSAGVRGDGWGYNPK